MVKETKYPRIGSPAAVGVTLPYVTSPSTSSRRFEMFKSVGTSSLSWPAPELKSASMPMKARSETWPLMSFGCGPTLFLHAAAPAQHHAAQQSGRFGTRSAIEMSSGI